MVNITDIIFDGRTERLNLHGNITYVYQIRVGDLTKEAYNYTIVFNDQKKYIEALHGGPGMCPYCFREASCQMFDQIFKEENNLLIFLMTAELTKY